MERACLAGLAAWLAAAGAAEAAGPSAFTCTPRGTIVSVDKLGAGFRRISATITMPRDPGAEAPPAFGLQVQSPDKKRSTRLVGMHSGPREPGGVYSRFMSFRLEEVDPDNRPLRQSEPAHVFLDWARFVFEASPDGLYAFRMVAPKAHGGEYEQSASLKVAAFPHGELVLLCLGTDFELTDLVIE